MLTPDTEQALVFYTCYQRIKSQYSHSVLPPDTNVCWPQFSSEPILQCKRGVSNESRHSHSVLTPDTEQALVTYSTHVSVSNPDTDYNVSIPDTNRMHE